MVMIRSGSVRRLAVLLVWTPAMAVANPHSIVPSGGESGSAGSFTLAYDYTLDSSVLIRERAGLANPIEGALAKRTDLLFHQYTHTITPKLEVGVFSDTWIYGALPIVITQARELRLADGVGRTDSSTIQDGFVPTGGFDAQDPTTEPGGDMVFRGVNRNGLNQIHVGLGTAFMNQRRDPTKPTWKLGAEARLAIGKTMDFDRMDTFDRSGVSTGVHELRVWTTVSRKIGRLEPWFELYWQAPIGAREGSLFQDPGAGATNTTIGQKAGGSFGVEAYAVDDTVTGNRISFDVGARIVSHFEGRGYSEMWEVFAFAGDSRVAGNPLILEASPGVPGDDFRSHPGITNIEGFLETALRTSIRAQLGPRVHLAATVDVAWKTDHAISFADAGIDLPMCQGAATTNCEAMDNDVVTPGTDEVNPLYNPRIDLVGHRYLSVDNLAIAIGVMGQVVF